MAQLNASSLRFKCCYVDCNLTLREITSNDENQIHLMEMFCTQMKDVHVTGKLFGYLVLLFFGNRHRAISSAEGKNR